MNGLACAMLFYTQLLLATQGQVTHYMCYSVCAVQLFPGAISYSLCSDFILRYIPSLSPSEICSIQPLRMPPLPRSKFKWFEFFNKYKIAILSLYNMRNQKKIFGALVFIKQCFSKYIQLWLGCIGLDKEVLKNKDVSLSLILCQHYKH